METFLPRSERQPWKFQTGPRQMGGAWPGQAETVFGKKKKKKKEKAQGCPWDVSKVGA